MNNNYRQATRDTKYQIGMEVKVDRDKDDFWLDGKIIDQTSIVIIVELKSSITPIELKKSSDWDIIKIKY